MEEKTTMEITNDRLEEAIKDYAADRTKEKLTAVLNLLRPTKLLVPAMLKAPDQPTPCFLKSGAGEQYFVVYTSKSRWQMHQKPGTLKHAIPGVQQRCRKTGIEFKRNGHQSIYR